MAQTARENACDLHRYEQDPKILVTLTRAYLLNGITAQARTTIRLAKDKAEKYGMSSLAEQIETQFTDLLKPEGQ